MPAHNPPAIFCRPSSARAGPERNITGAIAACNGGGGGQVCGAAGSRLQSSSGRIVFSGHSGKGGGVCVWYSDDGGDSYAVSASGVFPGNEQSIADLRNGSLYMNGRGTSFPFAGHRASYWSHDDGATWSAGQIAANLTEPNQFGCDGAVIAVPNGGVAGSDAATDSNAATYNDFDINLNRLPSLASTNTVDAVPWRGRMTIAARCVVLTAVLSASC